MTWAMKHANGFGDYFLDGDYVGWDEQIEKHYFETLSDEEQAKFNIDGPARYGSHIARKFLNPLEGEGFPVIALPSLKEHERPTEFEIEFNRSKEFGSLIKLTNRLIAVDVQLMALIEEIEPDVHDFWAIKITMPNGEVYPRQYYCLRIGNHFDSFLPDQSDEGAWTGENGFYHIFSFTKKHCANLAMSKEINGSAHLWREVRLGTPDIYFSDALAAKIKESGLRLPKILKLKDV